MDHEIQRMSRQEFHRLTLGFIWRPDPGVADRADGWRELGYLEHFRRGERWDLIGQGALRRAYFTRKRNNFGGRQPVVEFRIDDGTVKDLSLAIN